MVSLARKAVQNGYRALFIEAQDLFDEMYSSLADRSTRRLLRSLANVDVLAIDELGYANIKQEQTNIFFKLLEDRHRRKPTLVTTNLPYPAWQDFLGNAALTKALLSRLRERCHTITIDGPCIRPQTGYTPTNPVRHLDRCRWPLSVALLWYPSALYPNPPRTESCAQYRNQPGLILPSKPGSILPSALDFHRVDYVLLPDRGGRSQAISRHCRGSSVPAVSRQSS
jgi:IstB-like ATP binding protein